MPTSDNLNYIDITKNKNNRKKGGKINVREVKKLLDEVKDSVIDYVEEPSFR